MQTDPVLMSLKEGYQRPNQLVFKAPVKEKKSMVVNGIDLLENVPPRTENEVRFSILVYIYIYLKKICSCIYLSRFSPCSHPLGANKSVLHLHLCLLHLQLLRMFFRQQDELRRLKDELTSKDVRIRQLELELNNLKNASPNNA